MQLNLITKHKERKNVTKAWLRIFMFGILNLLFLNAISGCGTKERLPKAIETYEQRLSNVLGFEVNRDKFIFELNAPPRTSFARTIPKIEMNLREFYRIELCPITQLIAQRNTSLGKVQLPSQRFKYELEVVQALKECAAYIQSSRADSKSADTREMALIEAWLEAKLSHLNLQWANLITQSEEIHLSFTQSASYLNAKPDDTSANSLLALKYLISIHPVKHDSTLKIKPTDLNELEDHLQLLIQTRFFAKLLRSLELFSFRFELINEQLQRSLPDFQCHSPSFKSKLDILRNVFSKFYLQEIQEIGSVYNNYYYQLDPVLTQLFSIDTLPMSYREFFSQAFQTRFNQYRASMDEHIIIWQTFFERCAIKPTDI